ncbi:MAG: thioredoxin family protein [Firmicutes bacterium]|nr:thioredoxin family protein [Bacillota bacterium]
MRRYFLAAVAVIVAVVIYVTPVFSGSNGIHWLYSYDQALQMSKSTGKTLMIYFYTDWQEWCKKMDEETFANPDVVEMSEKFVCLRVNSEKEQALAGKYHAKASLTIIFIQTSGIETNRVISFSPAGNFLKEMQKAVR